MAKKIYKLLHPSAQATSGQLWYLHLQTGENTRDWKLTQLQAQAKITKFKANPPKPKADKATPAQARKVTKRTRKATKTILEPSHEGKRTQTRKHARGGGVTPLSKVEQPSLLQQQEAKIKRDKRELSKAK